MINFSDINSSELFFGDVVGVDKNDKKGLGIKVKIFSVFDEIPTEYIPYAYPLYMDNITYDLPYIGERVYIKFLDNDRMKPMWYRKHTTINSEFIEDQDYESGSILYSKDLSKYDLDGYVLLKYDKTNGFVFELKRNDNISHVILRNDNSILLKNGGSKQRLHLSDTNISIGSENQSQQPCVVGNDNKEALERLNTAIDELFKLNKELLDVVAKSSSASPYTKHLSVPIKKLGLDLEKLSKKHYDSNDEFFPQTLSKVVTIDKTNENEG